MAVALAGGGSTLLVGCKDTTFLFLPITYDGLLETGLLDLN